MVYFVCGGCGDSFKRKQADMHTYKCRNWSFSCMDCNKEFPGMSYATHTQCISESEKYFGAHHVAKTSKDKNAVWIEKVREHIASVTIEPRYSRLVERMLQYPNIPRKQQKFENFLKTSMNVTHRETVKEIWKLVLGAETAKTETAASTVDNKENNGSTETASSTVDSKESNGLTKDDVSANGSVIENGHNTLKDHPADASKTDKKKKNSKTLTEEMEIDEKGSKDSPTINVVESEKKKKSKKQKTTEDEEDVISIVINRSSKDKDAVWMKKVCNHFASTTIKPYYSRLINRMLKYPKIPRKQEKFENFLETSMNISHKETVEELWKLVSGAATATTAASTVDKENDGLTEDNGSVNGGVTENGKKKKSDKKKNSETLTKQMEIDDNDSDDSAAINGVEYEKKKKSKKRKTTDDDEEENNSLEEEDEPKLTKSAKRRKRKHIQSATEEPDVLDPFKTSTMVDEQEKDFGDLEDISVGTVMGKDNFKWKFNIKKLIKEGPAEGIKLKNLLNKIEQLHNDELVGSAHSLPKDTLHGIMMKMLAKKPFIIANNMAKMGKKK